MPLVPGTRLGSYEVVSAIGVGGMGEVYRAKDIDLGRDVAIKVLPEGFAQDPDRLARLEREARTLASLNHPNIAIIHSLEKTDPPSGAGLRALVMELVDGPTLADRITQGPIPLDEALPIAKQIADALGAAHEQGIIHRDLKPANIKVRPDGTVKVLDFGLAKLVGVSAAVGETASISPTITTPAMTQLGVILGTAAYMSPEQAKGREADKRSDVWAFGCVLYEMLAGKRAFDGDDVSDALASVLKSEPDWSALDPNLASGVRTLLQRCLVKDRRHRVADIAVVHFVLAEASALAAGPGLAVGQDTRNTLQETDVERRIQTAVAAARRTLLWRRIVPAMVILAAAFAGFAAWRLLSATPSSPVAFVLSVPEGQQFSSVGRQMLTISPDGTRLVYVATGASVRPGLPTGTGQRLYLRSLSEFDSRLIPGSEIADGVGNPVFSPDGASIAFFSGGMLKRIPATGGTPVTICPAETLFGMTWD
jgi:serine/threonine protein kinase